MLNTGRESVGDVIVTPSLWQSKYEHRSGWPRCNRFDVAARPEGASGFKPDGSPSLLNEVTYEPDLITRDGVPFFKLPPNDIKSRALQ